MGFGGGSPKKKGGHLKKVREKGGHVKYFSSAKMGYILLFLKKCPHRNKQRKYLNLLETFLLLLMMMMMMMMMKVFISSQDKKYISYVTIFE